MIASQTTTANSVRVRLDEKSQKLASFFFAMCARKLGNGMIQSHVQVACSPALSVAWLVTSGAIAKAQRM